jgi:hypothetical protein
MSELPSPGSSAKRKRGPLGAQRPLSPIERLQQESEYEQDDDLDCFRQHKRYITEVRGEDISPRAAGVG